MAGPRLTLGHFQGDSLTNPMLITAFYLCRLEGHREPRNVALFALVKTFRSSAEHMKNKQSQQTTTLFKDLFETNN